jgi:hypothetical protein
VLCVPYSVSNNNIGTEGGEALARAIRMSPVLQQLQVSGNPMLEADLSSLLNALKESRSGTSVLGIALDAEHASLRGRGLKGAEVMLASAEVGRRARLITLDLSHNRFALKAGARDARIAKHRASDALSELIKNTMCVSHQSSSELCAK